MKICVLGAGVIGVSTAYTLGRMGHDVIVIDKGDDVAAGASHANGAQLSYSYTDPLAGPTTLRKLPHYMLGLDPAVQLKFALRREYLSWGLSFLGNCSAKKFRRNKEARETLARASEDAIALIEDELPKGALKKTGQGKIIIAQTQNENEAIRRSAHYLSPEQCIEKEPALALWQGGFMGGLYAQDDSALDTQVYCKVLREACQKKFGVTFLFGQSATRFIIDGAGVKAVETDQDSFDVDCVVTCLGNEANELLSPVGMQLPIYPIRGYSLTLPMTSRSPKVSVTDLKNKTVYANLGNCIRIAGFVDTNQNPEMIEGRIDALLSSAKAMWPDIAGYEDEIERWSHSRPMTPSGVPVIGPTKIKGLYLNAGHGSLGYTFAAGSAMKIASVIGHAKKNKSRIKGVHYAS